MKRFSEIVWAILDFIWRTLRILWVCRVPAASAIAGGLLLWQVEQARDLFADTGLSISKWIGFFFLLFLWAWLVHATARRALQFDEWVPEAHRPSGLSDSDRIRLRGEFWYHAVWIPRLLGFLVFVFVWLALSDTRGNFESAESLDQAQLAISRLSMQLWFTAAVAVVYTVGVLFRRRIRARMTGSIAPPLLASAQSAFLLKENWEARHEILSSRINQLLIVIAGIVTATFVVALVWPVFLSDWLPRAIFLPVLLGSGLLLLGEVAALSHRYATPLLLLFFVIGAVFSHWLKHYNDVQWVASAPKAAATHHQTTIADAIERWKADNGCSGKDCKPIVVTGAGGASRAGFFTVTVVGALMDAADKPSDLRRRIFALSTVSGSSVGAVMMRAAWMDAVEKGTPDVPPCQRKDITAWFGNDKANASSPKGAATGSWRDCFQQLMAGDFLSPVFVGIAFRDLFPLGNIFTGKNWFVDRAGLLEQSLERWYAEVAGESASDCNSKDKDNDNTGLCRRVGHLADRPDLTQKGDWIPLLFINGTSVSTGRRILVSDVRTDCLQGTDQGFLETSYDYSELRNPSREKESCAGIDHKPDAIVDLRLSSASMMSARFPIISPHGVIRRGNKTEEIVDSVVDGGYFENGGLATAADIVRELQKAGMAPIVIQIGNDPVDLALPRPGQIGAKGQVDARPPIATSQERSLFDEYTSIGRALYATRSGHEDGHLDYLRQTLGGEPVQIGLHEIPAPTTDARSKARPLCRSPVAKKTSMKTVSMSWWLSQPVQAYLDAQLCTEQSESLTAVLGVK
jgi:hypothetical protein